MKVLFVTRPVAPPWYEGCKNTVYGLARRMSQHEVHLLAPKGFSFTEKNIVSEHVYSKSGIAADLFPGQKLRLFLRLLRPDGIDIYHFFFYATPLVALAARTALFFNRKKTVQTVVSVPPEGAKARDSIFSKNVVVGSRFMQARLKEEGIEAEVIPFGVDTEALGKPYSVTEARKAFGFGPEPVILFAGHLYDFSGWDVVAGAMPAVVKKFPDARFAFALRNLGSAGENANLEKLKVMIKKNNLESNARLPGTVEDIIGLIKASDLLVFTPRTMQAKLDYPLIVLEAMALSKPAVISDIPPLNELFEEGTNKVVKPNPVELSKAIIGLLSNKSAMQVMGSNARKLVESRFDIAVSAKKYSELYRRVLNG